MNLNPWNVLKILSNSQWNFIECLNEPMRNQKKFVHAKLSSTDFVYGFFFFIFPFSSLDARSLCIYFIEYHDFLALPLI